jgi:hypothetical protein
MEIANLGKADGLPPVDWAAVAAKLDAGSAPAPGAANSRTTWLSTVNEDGSPHVTAVGALWCTDESRVSWLSQVVDGWFSRVRIDRFPGSGSPLFACPRIRQAAAQGRNRAR